MYTDIWLFVKNESNKSNKNSSTQKHFSSGFPEFNWKWNFWWLCIKM